MRGLSARQPRSGTLRRKLFGYMLVLAALLAFAILTGLFLLGRFTSTRSMLRSALDMQMEVFEREVSSHCEDLAAMGVQLSRTLGDALDARQTTLAALNGDADKIRRAQEALFDPLCQAMLRTDCSGAFVILNAAVDGGASGTRTGLYLQRGGIGADPDILLYRGIAAVGKAHGAMPHRKWRLELSVGLIPGYDEVLASSLPLEQAYRFSPMVVLPGTSEQAMLLLLPVPGADGTVWGVCGFEVSESYFKSLHAQPALLPHLTCLLTTGNGARLNTGADALSCGVRGGYFAPPDEDLAVRERDGLCFFTGADGRYVGLTRPASLTPGDRTGTLAVMIPQADYARALRRSAVQIVLLVILLVFFAVGSCLVFSRRYLSPVLRGLAQIRRRPEDRAGTDIPEIDDLLAFLARKDELHDSQLSALEQQRRQAQAEAGRLEQEIDRLAGQKRAEIDPDSYALFRESLNTLTPKEREVFELYLAGRNGPEIIAALGISENTLKYHNRNLYSKLGVSSRRELLQNILLLRRDRGEKPV